MTLPIQIFRDAVSPQNMKIDDTYQGVFAYANGRYAWNQAQIDRFLNANKHLYRIDVNGSKPTGASILDVERYDATPEDAPGWVKRRNEIVHDAGVYCQLSSVTDVLNHIGNLPCNLIVADWTGKPHIPELRLRPNIRLIGVQYDSTPGYDLTAIYSAAWLEGRRIL